MKTNICILQYLAR